MDQSTSSGQGALSRATKAVTPFRGALLLLTLSFGAALVDGLAEPYPLSDVHWDSSVYLWKAKAYSAGGFVESFRADAGALSDAVARGVYPTPYWSFVRLGHIALMGTVVGITGTDEHSIAVLAWIYRGLLVLGLFLSALLPVSVARVVNPTAGHSLRYLAASLSLLLYLCSAVSGYLSGNLVSEVPALALVSLSAWSLVRAWEIRSATYAVISGCAGFTLYVVRMESVWVYVSFLAAMAWLVTRNPTLGHDGRRALVISGATAALLYFAYSWLFFPLTDPRLLVSFAESAAKQFAAEAGEVAANAPTRIVKQLVAANGLLWVGAVLSLLSARSNRVFLLGAVWMLISLIPVGIGMTHGAGTETRMYATLTPALLLLSTVGWEGLGSRVVAGRATLRSAALVAGCVLLVLISQQASYSALRSLPGMWRLQFVREYLAPMPFERVDIHLPELVRIERVIALFAQPFTLVASPGMQGADDIMLIQYLHGAEAGGRWRRQFENRRKLEEGEGSRSLGVHLATEPVQDLRAILSLPANEQVFFLRKSGEESWSGAFSSVGSFRDVLTTEHYSLSEFTRAR